MKRTLHILMAVSAFAIATPAFAQDPQPPGSSPAPDAAAGTSDNTPAVTVGRPITIQYVRPQDQRGLNVFETSKDPVAKYTGFRLDIGAGFVSEAQDLNHHNTAAPNIVNGVNTNQLIGIGRGVNQSAANLYLHAQLAPGIRVQLTSYLASRHHSETWVKDGYIQIDESPIDFVPLQALFKVMTVKAGHMEINYGDQHFRRTDNGNALFNPFVGNDIMDAFTTEVGAEVYVKAKNVIAMGGLTGGELHPSVLTPGQKSPSYLGKLGFDRQVQPALRVRVTGSLYKNSNTTSDTLYGGDRGGSRYFFVMENVNATETANAFSGTINPGFRNEVTAMQLNPFVKVHGLEVFGAIEHATGKATTELARRTFNQYAVDGIYRFLPKEQLYLGARYNWVGGQLANYTSDVSVNRVQVAGGWFVTPNVLAKAEYVNQRYHDFPDSDIRNGGHFHGVVLEGVVGF
ncbi:MAG TPA: hypothetical protein VL173_01165 [Vicinamibacterales bacterium]|nr:hypothetical protein [Vicinamibacterales bacterium]